MKKCSYCGKEYSDESEVCSIDRHPLVDVSEQITKCPLCGEPAEIGCVYGSDSLLKLRWVIGPPDWLKNIMTEWGGGEPVGLRHWLRGPHVQGVRCTRCRRIILEDS